MYVHLLLLKTARHLTVVTSFPQEPSARSPSPPQRLLVSGRVTVHADAVSGEDTTAPCYAHTVAELDYRVVWNGSRELGPYLCVDLEPEPGLNVYYARLRQVDGQMAWGSPIWVERPNAEGSGVERPRVDGR